MAAPIGSTPRDLSAVRDASAPAPARLTPLAIVSIGLDAVVGGTAADFLDAPAPRPGSPTPARKKTGEMPVIPPFARDMVSAIEPARNRLLDEAARLDWVRQAALDYIGRPAGAGDDQ